MERFISFFVKDKLVVNIIILTVLVVGLSSAINIKRETMPPTAIDKMIITVTYPGASPQDVELNAVVPIEDELKAINGIDQYTSVSLEGGAQIMIDLDQDIADTQIVKDEVFRKISISSITDIPSGVEDIIVKDMNTKEKSILKIGLSKKNNKNVTDKDLYNTADHLENQLKRLNGVSEISLSGYLDREIHVKVDPEKMSNNYISLSDVVNSIKTRNVRSTGGTLQSVYNEKNIVTIGEFENPMDVGDVIIRTGFEQRRVKVKDIASIEDGFEDEDVKIGVNGEKSVVLNIKKKENADIIQTVNEVKAYLETQKANYGNNYEISIISDDSVSVKSLMDVVISNAAIGFVLVFLVLLIFLDLKTSFWTAFGIPVSLLLTLIFMRINDYSLNIMTIGAIITVLGMLVDDAIVVSEVVYEKKNQGMPSMEAAIAGTKEVFIPVLVSILTTIFAFLPILLIDGTMGKFIFVFPVIISATLLFSLFEAVTLLPNHLAYSHIKINPDKKENWFKPVIASYRRFLRKALNYRYFVLGAFILMLFGSILFSNETLKNFVLFWDNSNEYVNIDIDVPSGTSIDKTEEMTEKLRKIIIEQIPKKELVSTFSQTGIHSGMMSTTHDYWSTIQIKLVPINERERTAGEIVADLRKKLTHDKLAGFTSVVLREDKAGPPTGQAVDIKVISKKNDEAMMVMNEIKTILGGINGVKDIDSDLKEGKKELRFVFDYKKMAQYGLDVESVASTVRTAYSGNTATSIQTVESRLDFIVELRDSARGSETHLLNLLVPNDSGRLIKLGEIACLKAGEGESEINHFNGDRSISITADIDSEKTTPIAVQKLVKENVKEFNSKYPSTYLLFEGEAKESASTMSDVGITFVIALFLIYLLVTLQFRSFTQPLIVMSVIPFGLIGVLIAFTLHGVPFSFMGVIGIIGLSGVVVNDSILMVNFINTLKNKNGTESRDRVFEDVAEGASLRLRAIIMTTVTTVAGLMPTVYGIGGNALTLVPVVMAMSYGLLFATLLTLVFVPCLYMINEDISGFFRQINLYGYLKQTIKKFTPAA
jgi:multidrug efflux pump subunit AcrB